MFLLPSKKYKNEILRLKVKIEKLQEMVGDPRYVVASVLSKDILSYDWVGIKDKKIKKEYAQRAKRLLNNEILMNEINGLYGELVKEIAMNSQNFKIVRDLRMTINGIKLIEENLERIGEDKEPTNKNLHESI